MRRITIKRNRLLRPLASSSNSSLLKIYKHLTFKKIIIIIPGKIKAPLEEKMSFQCYIQNVYYIYIGRQWEQFFFLLFFFSVQRGLFDASREWRTTENKATKDTRREREREKKKKRMIVIKKYVSVRGDADRWWTTHTDDHQLGTDVGSGRRPCWCRACFVSVARRRAVITQRTRTTTRSVVASGWNQFSIRLAFATGRIIHVA